MQLVWELKEMLKEEIFRIDGNLTLKEISITDFRTSIQISGVVKHCS